MSDLRIHDLPRTTTADDDSVIAIDHKDASGGKTFGIKVSDFNAVANATAKSFAEKAKEHADAAKEAKEKANESRREAANLELLCRQADKNTSRSASDANAARNDAITHENFAKYYADAAKDSQQLAAREASSVGEAVISAKSWAIGGTGTRAGEDSDNASYYAQVASAAASGANASAKAFSDQAKGYADRAKEARDEVIAAKAEADTVIQNTKGEIANTLASTKEEVKGLTGEAKKHADDAKTRADSIIGAVEDATRKSGEAKAYAEAAALSASASAASAAGVGESSLLSKSWAVGGTGVRAGEDTDNAAYYAQAANAAAGGGVSSFRGRSGQVLPESNDYTADMIKRGDSNVDEDLKKCDQSIQKTIADIKTSSGNIEKVTKDVASVTEQITSAASKISSLREELDQVKENIKNAGRVEIEKIKAKVDKAVSDIDLASTEIEKLKQNISGVGDYRGKIKEMISSHNESDDANAPNTAQKEHYPGGMFFFKDQLYVTTKKIDPGNEFTAENCHLANLDDVIATVRNQVTYHENQVTYHENWINYLNNFNVFTPAALGPVGTGDHKTTYRKDIGDIFWDDHTLVQAIKNLGYKEEIQENKNVIKINLHKIMQSVWDSFYGTLGYPFIWGDSYILKRYKKGTVLCYLRSIKEQGEPPEAPALSLIILKRDLVEGSVLSKDDYDRTSIKELLNDDVGGRHDA